jgi:hypothetical protein
MGLIGSTPSEKRPGKGVVHELNEGASSVLIAYARDAVPALGAAGSFEEMKTLLVSEHDWQGLVDDYGDKVYFERDGFRLTLVKKSDGKMQVDVRNWS